MGVPDKLDSLSGFCWKLSRVRKSCPAVPGDKLHRVHLVLNRAAHFRALIFCQPVCPSLDDNSNNNNNNKAYTAPVCEKRL